MCGSSSCSFDDVGDDMFKSFFTSQKCPDFAKSEAPEQKERRPFGADTQCGILLKYLERGGVLTVMKAIVMINGSEGGRRIREVRKYLQDNNRVLNSQTIVTKSGKRIKTYYL